MLTMRAPSPPPGQEHGRKPTKADVFLGPPHILHIAKQIGEA